MCPEPIVPPAIDDEPVEVAAQWLRDGRDEILTDWVERVRLNRSVVAGQALSKPLLLDHLPQLFDSILDRIEMDQSRQEAEQWAAIHGFSRRVTGYDVAETVIELSMLRRAIWSYLLSIDAPREGMLIAMERIDGMVDRAVITSLQAFLDPSAQMLIRRSVVDAEPALVRAEIEAVVDAAATGEAPA